MKSLKEFIITLFEDSELERVDYYIEKIKESLITTNRLFITYNSLLGLSIICFHLFASGYLNEIELFGQRISHFALIKRWFLTIPSAIFFVSTLVGYLRVYQMECIEWLIAKHRKKEFDAEIFRLTLPASHILGMDLLRRQDYKWIKSIALIPSVILAFGTVLLPIVYINWAYVQVLYDFPYDAQTILSWSISNFFIICGIIAIRLSQKI